VTFTGTDPDSVDPVGPLDRFVQAAGSGVASFQCSLGGGTYVTCVSPFTMNGLSVGVHTLQVRAVDAAGNADPNPASVTWVVQAQVPPTTTPPTTNPSTGLPATGGDSSTTLQLGVMLVALGLGATVIATRRRVHR
jgi:LPXTG-motif cell wall-anchored protein